MVTGYRLFGGLFALHGLAHFLNPTGPSLTKVVYACFDRISYIDLSGFKWSSSGFFFKYWSLSLSLCLRSVFYCFTIVILRTWKFWDVLGK